MKSYIKLFILLIFLLIFSTSKAEVHVSGSWGFSCGRFYISDTDLYYHYHYTPRKK